MWVIAISAFWTSLGAILFKFQFLPSNLPKLIGRSLYWVGFPLQIFALAHKSNFAKAIWVPPLTTIQMLLLGLLLASLSLYYLKRLTGDLLSEEILDKLCPTNRSSQGSFILASILGNTGYVGLAIVPALVSKTYLAWVVLYGVAHNLLGSYGLGVVLASYFGRSGVATNWWIQLRDIITVPSLWAFSMGWSSRHVQFPATMELGLQLSVKCAIPAAFLLIGMQLCQIQSIRNLHSALVPTILKMLVLPGIAGLAFTLLGLSSDARLAMVLMSGMPTAFASVILAEEYNLDRQLAASSILLSTVMLPLMIPFWLALFG